MALFKRKLQGSQRAKVEIDLPALQLAAGEAAAMLAGAEVNLGLVRARLADRCRDAGVAPRPSAEVAAALQALDSEGRRRVALGVALLHDCGIGPQLLPLLANLGPGAGASVFLLADATAALTMDLVRQSSLRAQEFSRQMIAHLGAAVRGEPETESQRQLKRLNYARLLAEAERAKMSAKDRMEYLRQLQQKSEPRRGKW